MESGEELYLRYIDGDESALAELVERYFDGLMYFINRYVADMNEAESLASDAFFEIMVHKKRYRAKASFKTYLYTVGRNKALNYLKKHKRITDISEAERKPSRDMTPEEKFIYSERLGELDKAISALPPDMRDAVHLVYLEELSYEEAAKVMKVEKKKIDNLIYRAKSILREKLS